MHNNIENIYNNLIADEKLKNGTKYERITAVVYKLLDETNTVFHDLRLRGNGKKAKHQIDVTIVKDSQTKRILVECKEYDKVVGIGIVRDFFGAVTQIKPDEAVVVTTKGFTKGAIDFANDEGIKLAILREAEDSDWDGLIRKVKINATVITIGTPTITWLAINEEAIEDVGNLLGEDWGGVETKGTFDEYLYNSNHEVISNYEEVLNPVLNKAKRIPNERTEGTFEFEETVFIKMHGHYIPVIGFDYEFTSGKSTLEVNVDDGGKVAVLLFEILNNESRSLIFQHQIEKWKFAENGEVINKI
ncbi:restriction endonuclease [Paenibacillus peoriae]|uniref:restriction endonuclease n=1 Tax=Paenibacillus peoriae TaxID=59893 RepID=UPI00096D553F|nr:restriction endonuclease [Paenibacillus peoriae]OMF51003.1 hypothetical protein BK135_01760 [Paenibacillus peoriae]